MEIKWKIRHRIKHGDIGYLTYLHGILYAKEYGYDQTFEAYVAIGLAEFVQSFNPSKDRIWLAEDKRSNYWFRRHCQAFKSRCSTSLVPRSP